MIVVEGKGMVSGRLASKVAKLAINGERVAVINAQDIVVVGSRETIAKKYLLRVEGRVLSNPHFGPKYSKIPSKMFRRTVKGMLPNRPRAQEKFIKMVKVYNDVPKELAKEKAQVFDDYLFNGRNKAMTLKELALFLGGRW